MDKKLKSLDILKGIGILMIIAVHNRHFIMKDMSGLRQLINYGQMGCQAFFVVSGMALCHAWSHLAASYTADRHAPGGRHILSYSARFILRRYLRLAPGFLIILSVNLLLNVLFIDLLGHSPGVIMNRDFAGLAVNVLFLHGLFPEYSNSVFPGGWYIGTAFLLYVLFPLLVCLFEWFYAKCARLAVFLPAAFLVLNLAVTGRLAGLPYAGLELYNNSFLYFFFPNQLPCFSLGILLYFQEKEGFCRKCPWQVSAVLAVLAGFASVRLYLMMDRTLVCMLEPSITGLFFYWLAVCFIHLEQACAFSFQSRIGRLLKTFLGFVCACGRKSYGMYLVHGFVSWYFFKDMVYVLTLYGYAYNDLALYALVYIPSVAAVYLLGLAMELLLGRIDRKLRPVG